MTVLCIVLFALVMIDLFFVLMDLYSPDDMISLFIAFLVFTLRSRSAYCLRSATGQAVPHTTGVPAHGALRWPPAPCLLVHASFSWFFRFKGVLHFRGHTCMSPGSPIPSRRVFLFFFHLALHMDRRLLATP